jgi:hypothetical protein
MTAKATWTVAVFAAAVLPVACKGGQDDDAPAVGPTAIQFKGKVEPKFAGDWKSTDGNSSLKLHKDGIAEIETTSFSQKGKDVADVAGKWLLDGSALLFDYQDRSRAAIVLKYDAVLSGSTLTLSQAKGRIKTTYHRK